MSLVITASGCDSGPKLSPVNGTILLDGSPIVGATLAFTPDGGGRVATGMTDDSGRFQLTTSEQNDGDLAGEYRVSVTYLTYERNTGRNTNLVQGLDSHEYSGKTVPVWGVPEQYINPETSGLNVTVPCPNDTVSSYSQVIMRNKLSSCAW